MKQKCNICEAERVVKRKSKVLVCEKCIKTAYGYCNTCEEFFDYWKFDFNIENAGHEGCDWRTCTIREAKGCIKDCIEDGCFGEERL